MQMRRHNPPFGESLSGRVTSRGNLLIVNLGASWVTVRDPKDITRDFFSLFFLFFSVISRGLTGQRLRNMRQRR